MMPNLEMVAVQYVEVGDLLDDGDGWDRVIAMEWYNDGNNVRITTESTIEGELDPMEFEVGDPIWVEAKD